MEKFKKLKIALISVLLALAVAFAAVALLLGGNKAAVYADGRTYTLDGNTVFYTAIRGAQIKSVKTSGEDAETETYHAAFEIGKNQTVAYRQNLAYSWISNQKDDDGNTTDLPEGHTFSIEISFGEINFKRFIIKMQSQQYVYTEDKISENYLIFTPNEGGNTLKLTVAQSLEEDEDGKIDETEVYIGRVLEADEKIKISFGDYVSGDYALLVNGELSTNGAAVKNVYQPYANYISSGDTAVTPLTFSAEFADDATDDTKAQMILYELNGQSFATTAGDEVEIKDNAAPAMCFDKTPSYLEHGKTIGLSYKVIDVLASSPRADAYYYVLSGKQYAATDYDYNKTDYSDESSEEESEDEDDELKTSPFTKVTSSSTIKINTDKNTFIPTHETVGENVKGLVKLYYEIYDVTGSNGIKDKIFVEWYAKPDALFNIKTLKSDADNSYFFKLIDDKEGVTYAQSDDTNITEYKATVAQFKSDYQAKINAAIEEQGGTLYAGSDKRFYLPAIEYNFLDEYFYDTDLSYTIYYRAKNSGSESSLASNLLSISLSEADTSYRFTIYVTDAFGNPMRYPANTDGEIEWETIETDDVWDEDYSDLLPFFEFDVSYKEATAENPEDLTLAYVGTNYSGVSFKIDGVADTYTQSYKLYVFDRNAMNDELGVNLDYAAFTENIEKLFNNQYLDNVNTRKYFKTVKAADDLLETDSDYEQFKALEWNSSNRTFTPQTIDDFYVVELELTDNRSLKTDKKYAVVAASVQATALKGESDWVENNLTSIILLSVAGACLIALIVLLIVKPKDKGDIDAIYTEVEEKSKKKSKK